MGSLAVLHAATGPADRHGVHRMLLASPHRGSELKIHDQGGTALGVSNDPAFRDAHLAVHGDVAACFAGWLDNAEELRSQLGGNGAAPPGTDPAALLLAAYRHWGESAANRLRGAFAAVIADGRQLMWFRDHIGFKPLFQRVERERTVIASEAKQVVAGAGIPREPDVEVAEGVFFGQTFGNRTALRGVERLPPATIATLGEAGSPRLQRYWDPSGLLESAAIEPAEVPERLAALLDRVVSRAVTGNDVISLSGGIDSPTVAAFAAPRHLEVAGRPLPALSIVYPDYPEVDERRFIEAVAERLQLPLRTYVEQSTTLQDLDFWVDLADGPWDTLPVPLAVEQYRGARALGGRTVMTGDLAEAVFTNWSHVIGHLVLHGRWRAAARLMQDKRAAGASWRGVALQLAPSLTPAFLATRYVDYRYRDRQHVRTTAPWIQPTRVPGRYRWDLAMPARRRWLDMQVRSFGKSSVALEVGEIAAAHCGVHVKRPMVDVDLWEFALSLRAEAKFPDLVPKSPIRRAMRGKLPDLILDRRDKTVFNAHALGTADYDGLGRWLVRPAHRMQGVDYDLLARRIERREMTIFELIWAYDLARVHAFLAAFE